MIYFLKGIGRILLGAMLMAVLSPMGILELIMECGGRPEEKTITRKILCKLL